MSDSSRNQRRFRTFNVIDYFNREALGIDIAVSLPASRITRYLDKLPEYHGYPLKIRVDNVYNTLTQKPYVFKGF
ncbi:hypothetical protein [Gilliamella sp. Pas-s25]|uniref:hypothetical protein n=1 Tax=Gilliamella sp. Pas-s25 TaxID=2687310 RepID=UPI00135EE94B|nr:hypothetical protein [Gilliamella sp. Pas-s25]MWP62544.1 hypothetical protein [Gilliamella sp. Pas-s25]